MGPRGPRAACGGGSPKPVVHRVPPVVRRVAQVRVGREGPATRRVLPGRLPGCGDPCPRAAPRPRGLAHRVPQRAAVAAGFHPGIERRAKHLRRLPARIGRRDRRGAPDDEPPPPGSRPRSAPPEAVQERQGAQGGVVRPRRGRTPPDRPTHRGGPPRFVRAPVPHRDAPRRVRGAAILRLGPRRCAAHALVRRARDQVRHRARGTDEDRRGEGGARPPRARDDPPALVRDGLGPLHGPRADAGGLRRPVRARAPQGSAPQREHAQPHLPPRLRGGRSADAARLLRAPHLHHADEKGRRRRRAPPAHHTRPAEQRLRGLRARPVGATLRRDLEAPGRPPCARRSRGPGAPGRLRGSPRARYPGGYPGVRRRPRRKRCRTSRFWRKHRGIEPPARCGRHRRHQF